MKPAVPALAIVCAALVGCAGISEPGPPPPLSVIERRISPSAADPLVTRWLDDHYIWLDTTARVAAPQLLVLLPGTSGAPRFARVIGALAATQGYHVIGLMYPDDIAVLEACAQDPDDDCMRSVRAEICDGTDASPHVAVDSANSVTGRLTALLRLLTRDYPDEQWSSFLLSDRPNWDLIAVGGLSQGGGHAAYLGVTRRVARVVMFGAPADGVGGAVAPWVRTGATPAARFFGFAHVRDPFPSIVPNWGALDLEQFGPLVVVEASALPFGSSHMLRTDLLPATGSYADAHPSMFGDAATPRDRDGNPVFAPVWRYMVGKPPQ